MINSFSSFLFMLSLCLKYPKASKGKNKESEEMKFKDTKGKIREVDDSCNIFLSPTEEQLFLKQFEMRIGIGWCVTDYKGNFYKFYRTCQSYNSINRIYQFRKVVSLSNGKFEQTLDAWGRMVDVFYKLQVKRKRLGSIVYGHSTIKFSPKDYCDKLCDYKTDCKKYRESPTTCFQTCKEFATNKKGSIDAQKDNKRILSRWKIKQEDLTEEMIVTIPRKKIIYQTQGYLMSRVTNGSG